MKLLTIIVLLIVSPLAIYGQEYEQEEDNFHFIEAGIGLGFEHSEPEDAVFNIALSNSLGKYIGNFIDYSLYFDKSSLLNHEFSFKFGPYLRFNRYSYMAVSTGLSFFMNASNSNWKYMNGVYTYEDKYRLGIPVQAKLNLEMGRGFCLGLKGSYHYMMDKWVKDKGTAMIYLAYGW